MCPRKRSNSKQGSGKSTSETQPVDTGLGRLVKLIISKEFEEWLENDENLEIWENVTDDDVVEMEENNNTCVQKNTCCNNQNC